MPFANAWNEAVPDDNQIAGLYGDNLRDLRTDFSERQAAFAAGLRAARLDPEAVFGDANKGVAYYATDEGILYRWDSAAWQVAAINRHFVNLNSVLFTNPAVETDGLSVTIPAGFLTIGSVIDIRVRAKAVTLGTDILTVLLKFGATTLAGVSSPPGAGFCSLRALLAVTAASAQKGVGMIVIGNDFLDLSVPNPAEAISGAIVVKTTAPPVTGNFVHDLLAVRVIR